MRTDDALARKLGPKREFTLALGAGNGLGHSNIIPSLRVRERRLHKIARLTLSRVLGRATLRTRASVQAFNIRHVGQIEKPRGRRNRCLRQLPFSRLSWISCQIFPDRHARRPVRRFLRDMRENVAGWPPPWSNSPLADRCPTRWRNRVTAAADPPARSGRMTLPPGHRPRVSRQQPRISLGTVPAFASPLRERGTRDGPLPERKDCFHAQDHLGGCFGGRLGVGRFRLGIRAGSGPSRCMLSASGPARVAGGGLHDARHVQPRRGLPLLLRATLARLRTRLGQLLQAT